MVLGGDEYLKKEIISLMDYGSEANESIFRSSTTKMLLDEEEWFNRQPTKKGNKRKNMAVDKSLNTKKHDEQKKSESL